MKLVSKYRKNFWNDGKEEVIAFGMRPQKTRLLD